MGRLLAATETKAVPLGPLFSAPDPFGFEEINALPGAVLMLDTV